jgi:hypothetical protein
MDIVSSNYFANVDINLPLDVLFLNIVARDSEEHQTFTVFSTDR